MNEQIGMEEAKDHLLIRAWLNEKEVGSEEDHCLGTMDEETKGHALSVLRKEGFLNGKEPSALHLTSRGETRAKDLVRRQRLSECLFSIVLNLPEETVRDQACRLEHEKVLTPEAVEGICSFLGHPPSCPHGKQIPPGECCRLFVDRVQPLVGSLDRQEVGENYKITFIVPRSHSLLERLANLGAAPGMKIRLLQKRPSYLIRVEETEIAMDKETAEGIYVVHTA